MSTLVLQRFHPLQRVVLQRFGPDNRTAPLPDVNWPTPISIIIGPPGPKGDAGSAPIERIAAFAVGGHRVIAMQSNGQVRHADKDIAGHRLVIGVSITAAAAGELVNLLELGEVIHSGWAWQPGTIWLGNDGQLTQTLPETGLLIEVARATDPTRIFVNPRIIAQY
jgi:hypothetical protein